MVGGRSLHRPPPLKYMNKINKEKALQRIKELRKNPPKVTEEHHKGAARMLEQHKKFEESKDRSISNERKGLAKDVASFVYNQVNGVGQLFNGIGEGKKHRCSICKERAVFNTNDHKWYCAEHRWFGNLSEEQQKKELANVN